MRRFCRCTATTIRLTLHATVRSALIAATCTVSVDFGAARAQQLPPTEALHDFHVQLLQRGRSEQAPIAEGVLTRTNKDGLDATERFALAELFFVALNPDSSDARFTPFTAGNDLRARIALQRRMRIRMAAYTVYRGMADSIAAYRQRFAPHTDDPWHLMSPVATLARYHADRGEHATAVRLVMDEIETLPIDGTFFSHTLPGMFLESFRAEGMVEAALNHMRRVRDALVASGERSARGEDPGQPDHVSGVVHRLEAGLLADLGEREMQRFLRGQLVGTLYGWIARAER